MVDLGIAVMDDVSDATASLQKVFIVKLCVTGVNEFMLLNAEGSNSTKPVLKLVPLL